MDPKSDFYDELSKHTFTGSYSKEEIEFKIYNLIDNLPNNHYGKFAEQTEVKHNFLI
jgi:hypothetical protein